jgi:hypothetical protein
MTATIGTRCFRDDYELLRAELARLDLRIRLRCKTATVDEGPNTSDQLARAMYIAPVEAAALLATPTGRDRAEDQDPDDDAVADLGAQLEDMSAEIDARTTASAQCGIDLSLPRLGRLFGLTPIELQTLIVCLAPELRAKYDRLYAYLQDDITRRKPSRDLVLELLCESETERWSATQMLHESSTLMRWKLLQTSHDPLSPSGSSGLAQFLSVDPRITQFLLGDSRCDARLDTVAALLDGDAEPPMADPDVEATANLLWAWAARGDDCSPPVAAPVIYLRGGAAGIGTLDVAHYLCGAAAVPMLAVDTAAVLTAGADHTTTLMRVLCREALLQRCALYLAGADALLAGTARQAFNALRAAAADARRPLILAGDAFWSAPGAFGHSVFRQLTIGHPDVHSRRALWRGQLAGDEPDDGSWSDTLASRFVLSARQIRNAAQIARHAPDGTDGGASLTLDALTAACRAESEQDLGQLAAKVEIRRSWDDLVLPEDKIAQLQEICEQIRHRHVVYGDWGYGQRLGHGTGVTVLFSGQSGTGKTVAAQVVAGDTGLPLYKIDLSGVVSKYIGETEKNLAKIFERARAGNAVLFFDEADALFGKRTEVSDAHDRYANIETSYLLQKLEEHDGVVILASNLRANLDDAFTRRIRCVVEFPFPDEAARRRIWQSHFPAQAPLADDVDLDYLARAFPVAGGNISNIAVGAAFLAAADDTTIAAQHVVASTRREYDKLGKLWAPPAQPGVQR